MKRLGSAIIGITLVFFCSAIIHTNEEIGIRTHILADDEKTDQIDKLFTKWDNNHSPGAVVAVFRKGKILFKKAYGMANLEYAIPLDTTSKLNIGSVSKQFTAFCIALLESQGKLDLDDEITQYIPEVPVFNEKITLRHLVYHTSGMRDHQMLIYLGGLDGGEFHSAEEVIKTLLSRQKNLNFKPGEKYAYCNSGYLLLGEIVRRVSGMSLREFADQNIFKPFGMKDSFFHDDYTRIVKNRAWSYFPDGKGGYVNYIDRNDIVGCSGVFSTVEDLFLWDQKFNQAQVGGPEVIQKVLSQGKLNNGKVIPYSYGWEHVTYKGLKVVKHDGLWGGYGAMILRFPGEKFTTICLSNNRGEMDTRRICHQIAEIYLKDRFIEEHKTSYHIIDLPKNKLEDKIGTYRSPKNGNLMNVTLKDNALLCEINSFIKMEYSPISPNEFKAVRPEAPSVFKFVKTENHPGYEIQTFRNEEQTNVYAPVQLYSPSEQELQEYIGGYYSEELDNTYVFFIRERKLFIRYAKAPQRSPRSFLRPTIKDEFAAWPAVYQFLRNKKGKIIACVMGMDVSRDIKFVKIEK